MLSYFISFRGAVETTACLWLAFFFSFSAQRSFMFQVSGAYGASDELCACGFLYVFFYICFNSADEKQPVYSTWTHFFVELSFSAFTCNLFAENMFSGHLISRIWYLFLPHCINELEKHGSSTTRMKYSYIVFMSIH